MSLFDMLWHNLQEIFSFKWGKAGEPARFDQGTFGVVVAQRQRSGQGEGGGGGYKVQPRVNETAPTPFGGQQ